jgi:hypothetical protein
MSIIAIAFIIGYLAVVLLAYSIIRDGARRERAAVIALDEYIRWYNGDHPCSECGQPTGWTWYGSPLCVPCRKREIEGA